jgi:hypothetical protein
LATSFLIDFFGELEAFAAAAVRFVPIGRMFVLSASHRKNSRTVYSVYPLTRLRG